MKIHDNVLQSDLREPCKTDIKNQNTHSNVKALIFLSDLCSQLWIVGIADLFFHESDWLVGENETGIA